MNTVPRMRPQLNKAMKSLVSETDALYETMSDIDAPLAISLPDVVRSNAKSFVQKIDELGINGRVFAAHKATASRALTMSLRGICGIDVASSAELRGAMASGFKAEDIIATGPKTTAFLGELLSCEATIIVDSFEELKRLHDLSPSSATVLLRMTRTMINDASIKKTSRFGMDSNGYDRSLKLLRNSPNIILKGLAFHLDSQSNVERYTAIQRSMHLLLNLQDIFPQATVLDIGGGYGAEYGVSYEDTVQYEALLKNAMIMGDRSMTWQGYGYGLTNGGGRITGDVHGLDRVNESHGLARFEQVVTSTVDRRHSLAQELADNLIEVWIEPGAALFSDAGLLVTQIIEVRSLDGNNIIVVDAHRNQICFENNEALSDPILISRTKEKHVGEFFIAGNLCAENDMMSYRKIVLDSTPSTGDLLIWTHTGAYRMHFSASQAIGHNLAIKYSYKSTQGLYKEDE